MIPLAFLERVSRQKFTHVGLTGVDCRRIMHDTVHDSVRDYAAAKAGMPFTGFVLRTKDRWPLIISALKDLQQIFVLLLVYSDREDQSSRSISPSLTDG